MYYEAFLVQPWHLLFIFVSVLVVSVIDTATQLQMLSPSLLLGINSHKLPIRPPHFFTILFYAGVNTIDNYYYFQFLPISPELLLVRPPKINFWEYGHQVALAYFRNDSAGLEWLLHMLQVRIFSEICVVELKCIRQVAAQV